MNQPNSAKEAVVTFTSADSPDLPTQNKSGRKRDRDQLTINRNLDERQSEYCSIQFHPTILPLLSKRIEENLKKNHSGIEEYGLIEEEFTVEVLRQELTSDTYNSVIAQIPWKPNKGNAALDDSELQELHQFVLNLDQGTDASSLPRYIATIGARMAFHGLNNLEDLGKFKNVQKKLPQGEEPIQYLELPALYRPGTATRQEKATGLSTNHVLDLERTSKSRKVRQKIRQAFCKRYYPDGILLRDLLLEDWKRTSGILKVSGIMTSLLDDMLHDNPQSRTVRLWNAITVPLFGKRILQLLQDEQEDWRLLKDTGGCAGQWEKKEREQSLSVLKDEAYPILLPHNAELGRCRKSAAKILDATLSNDPPKELFISADELNNILEILDFVTNTILRNTCYR